MRNFVSPLGWRRELHIWLVEFLRGCTSFLGRWGFRRLRAASDFARGGKVTKTPPGTAPDEHSVLIVAYPTPSGPSGHLPLTGGVGPGPHYEGRAPVRCCIISGAQNLSDFPQFNPGHWALSLQKLPLARFHNSAWLCRTNGTWSINDGRPKGLPTQSRKSLLKTVGEGLAPPAGRSRTALT